MTLDAGSLIDKAVGETGLDDFGGRSFLEGLELLVASLNDEADLTDLGTEILGLRLHVLLRNRLRVEQAISLDPAIGNEVVEGPIVIIGLPRTGTTALSHLVTMAPEIRSLRLWESSDPVPPPETATEHTDPRIEETERGLRAMYEAFPRMLSMYFQTATGATECQDLLGMEFRTAHFDGMAHVPSYTRWVLDCDMAPAYEYHRRVLQLLQWRCPPRLWHLKTPVHMLALDALLDAYPGAKFLWTHREPAAVLGSVCSLIAYTRSWVSDRDDAEELGRQQVELWAEALSRAIAAREHLDEARFADIDFAELGRDPVPTVAAAFDRLGLSLSDEARRRMRVWAGEHRRGEHGAHEYALDSFGLEASQVRERFAFYTERFGIDAAGL